MGASEPVALSRATQPPLPSPPSVVRQERVSSLRAGVQAGPAVQEPDPNPNPNPNPES